MATEQQSGQPDVHRTTVTVTVTCITICV